MLGFLPGFAYMGEIDARIAAPRKIAPRAKVPAGSVAIAGRQTGIYPFRLARRLADNRSTDVEMFTPNHENPTFLRAGDSVKFSKAND
jgi:inhibitor of KinA